MHEAGEVRRARQVGRAAAGQGGDVRLRRGVRPGSHRDTEYSNRGWGYTPHGGDPHPHGVPETVYLSNADHYQF
jgi:hypothetical protein